MTFVKKWAYEIVTVIIALWAALGVSGQQGLVNFVANVISAHKIPAAILSVLSVIVARLRTSPLAPSAQ